MLLQYQAQSCRTEYASASVSGTIKPFHDLILAWQPGLASRPSSLCKSPYRTFRKYDPGYILYFCRAGRPSCFVDYFGSGWPAWSRRCVFCGITWHRVQTFPNIYGPTQNHLLLFNAGHIFVPPCRGKHLRTWNTFVEIRRSGTCTGCNPLQRGNPKAIPMPRSPQQPPVLEIREWNISEECHQ